MKDASYVPTCYEQVFRDIHTGITPLYENYPEFKTRGHSQKEFDACIVYAKFCLYSASLKGNDNQLKAYNEALIDYVSFRSYANGKKLQETAQTLGISFNPQNGTRDLYPAAKNAASHEIPLYRFTKNEIAALKMGEQWGRGKDVVLNYCDKYGNKDAYCYDYRNIPINEGGRKDVFITFSGHQQTGTKSVDALYHYMRHLFEALRAEYPKATLKELVELALEYVFGTIELGKEDNQKLTAFSRKFTIRKKHEYRMYVRQLIAGGLPKGLIGKFMMPEAADTDTAQNILFLIATLLYYGLDNVNLIFISYPVYQMRVLTEMAKAFSKSEKAPNVHIRIADIPTKRFEDVKEAKQALAAGEITKEEFESLDFDDFRTLSYDQLLFQNFGLIVNCTTNLCRQLGDVRFELPGHENYPEVLKPLVPLGLEYGYKNIAREICGTDEHIALAMKLYRTLMLKAHDKGFSGKVQDEQMLEYTRQTNAKLVKEGLAPEKFFTSGISRLMSEKQFLTELFSFYLKNE